VPDYGRHGCPPTKKQPGEGWLYLQMLKQHDDRGHFTGTKLKAVYDELNKLIALLGKTTAYIERDNHTSRRFNARQNRKTFAFSKQLDNNCASTV
jgi:IS1 family transposase